jgi:hypothetical protein
MFLVALSVRQDLLPLVRYPFLVILVRLLTTLLF